MNQGRKTNPKKGRRKNDAQPGLTKKPAIQSYLRLLQQFRTADFVIIVLDARNVVACKYSTYEAVLGERLIYVINKVDLVPREVTMAWLRGLSDVAKTFAVCGNRDIGILADHMKNLRTPDKNLSVLVTGLSNMGRKTIAAKLSEIPQLEITVSDPWIWLEPSSDHMVLGSVDISSIGQGAVGRVRDFLARCSIHSVMETFHVSFFGDVDIVFETFEGTKRAAALEIIRQAHSGDKWLFCLMPNQVFVREGTKGISEGQMALLRSCTQKLDSSRKPYLFLEFTEQNAIKPGLLPFLRNLTAAVASTASE
jgi:hypothetical protein